MFKNLIKHYINIITINDIIMFGEKENIHVNAEEADIVLKYLKTNWENIIYGNEYEVRKFLDKNFDTKRSNKIFELCLIYKKRYSNYL